MKKVLFVLLVLVVAGVASAQESYTINATANQVAKLDRMRVFSNANGCRSVGLAVDCTQAQVDALDPAPENPPTIYADSLAGRTAYLVSRLVRDWQSMSDAIIARETADFCVWWRNTASGAQQNAVCAAAGLPSGCDVCRGR